MKLKPENDHIVWANFLLLIGIAVYLVISPSLFGSNAAFYDYEAPLSELNDEMKDVFLNDPTTVIYKMNCDSDSMGLALRCRERVFTRFVGPTEYMIEGDIYVYDNLKNSSVIHRLALCLDDNCSQMVFRGDNNAKGELVNRSQIVAKPMYLKYN